MLSLVESVVLVLIVYLIFILFFYKNDSNIESVSAYECGFEFSSSTRLVFSYRFFLISILFIVFDVEISLMLPCPFLMENEIGLWVFFMFLTILMLGLMYEFVCGSLDWLEVYN